MSYNSYALAGYIAGNLFCQALEAMQAEGKELTRLNLVETLESNDFQLAMADVIQTATVFSPLSSAKETPCSNKPQKAASRRIDTITKLLIDMHLLVKDR